MALVLKVVGGCFSFVFNVALARLLGAEGTGLYFLALTVTTIGSVIGRLGLDKALMRRVAVSSSRGDWGSAEGVYAAGLRICAAAALGVTLLAELAAPAVAIGVFGAPALVGPLRVMSLAILPHALMVLHTEMLLGVGAVRYGLLLQGFGVPLLAIPLLVVLAGPFGVAGACASYALASLIVLVSGRLFWRSVAPIPRTAAVAPSSRGLLDEGLPLLAAGAMYLVLQWTDTVMLGIWLDAGVVGRYNVAFKLAVLISFVQQAIDSVAAPRYSSLFRAGRLSELERTLRRFCALGALLCLPVVAVFLAAPALVLSVFGPEFRGGSLVLQVLVIAQFVNVATGSVSYVLIASGQGRIFRNITVVAGVLNVALNGVLIPLFGAVGAAVATGTSLLVMNAAFVYWVYRSLAIVPLPTYRAFQR